jgi:hypothetical protein
LPLDALDRPNRHILSGVRNCHDLLMVRVHEMMMTAGGSEMDPSGIAQLADDRPAVHCANDVGRRDERQAVRGAEARR